MGLPEAVAVAVNVKVPPTANATEFGGVKPVMAWVPWVMVKD